VKVKDKWTASKEGKEYFEMVVVDSKVSYLFFVWFLISMLKTILKKMKVVDTKVSYLCVLWFFISMLKTILKWLLWTQK
jgi:hypothetical protein